MRTGVTGGAQALPLGPGTLALLPPQPDDAPPPELRAEPAVAALVEQALAQPVAIESPAQGLLRASRGAWDLAQFQFARTGRARAAKRAGALWRDFLHAPLWRPARWGLALLLVANLVGLNVLAWRTQNDLDARRTANQALLTETFPTVKVVVDAPVQMAREVAQLRQATGAASPRDLEPMLQAFGQSAPASTAPTAIEFAAGELRLKGVTLAAAALTYANQRPVGQRTMSEANAVLPAPAISLVVSPGSLDVLPYSPNTPLDVVVTNNSGRTARITAIELDTLIFGSAARVQQKAVIGEYGISPSSSCAVGTVLSNGNTCIVTLEFLTLGS